MAKQTINIGASPNDGTGTPLRTAFDYTNQNFTELYTATGPSGNNIVVPGSATITGNLTVDTNTLFVDSANDRVGIGTASPAAGYKLDVRGNIAGGNGTIFGGITFSSRAEIGAFSNHDVGFIANSVTQYLIAVGGTHTWFNSGSTAMTLNSTGLGVGVGPGYKLDVRTAPATAAIEGSRISDATRTMISGQTGATYSYLGIGANQNVIYTSSGRLDIVADAQSLFLRTGTSNYLNLDTSGNVGIGVTPSAWLSSLSALQVKGVSGLYGAGSSEFGSVQNCFYNASSQWIYGTTAASGRYAISSGVHQWYNAPSGTVNTAITFTQAMTLDASGNLLVGATSQNGSWNTKLTISNDSGTTKWAVGPYLGGVTNFLISAGASAGVYLNGTAATSWTSASDERLKDIIEPISNAVSKVASLRAVIGKFKFDENNTRKPFLIAQDIQAVLPEAVDASNPDKLGVAYTDVIPLLVAAIKELAARVQTLEAK
jgi:hypothetical protein